jgi:hypothetical protein
MTREGNMEEMDKVEEMWANHEVDGKKRTTHQGLHSPATRYRFMQAMSTKD